MGKENVKVNSDQMAEILSLLRKETLLEDEAKQSKEAEESAAAASSEQSADVAEQATDLSGQFATTESDVKEEAKQKQWKFNCDNFCTVELILRDHP